MKIMKMKDIRKLLMLKKRGIASNIFAMVGISRICTISVEGTSI